MWNTFHLQSSRDPIIYFLFRIENPSYNTDYKPAVSEPMGLHQKIISYLHHRYCHSSALVNQVRSACARLLLMRVAVTTGQCVTTSVPSVPSPSVLLHIHIQPDTMTHIVLNCAADLQSETAVLANVDITEAVRRCKADTRLLVMSIFSLFPPALVTLR